MKIINSIAVFSLILASCGNTSTVGSQNNKESKSVNSKSINEVVSPSEFKVLLNNNDAQLIDVRTAEEYNEGFIPGSTNIDFYAEDFRLQLATLDKNKPVLVYCRSGNRSGQAVEILIEMGFKEVYDLEGGYNEWEK